MFKPKLILITSFVFSTIAGFLAYKSQTCKCGTSSHAAPENYIISGLQVKNVSKYPFMATFHNSNSFKWSGCGGAIISPTTILTAAHCIVNWKKTHNGNCREQLRDKCYFSPDEMKVGIFKTSTEWPSHYEEIEKIIPHPNFTTSFYSNDIALIKLKKPIQCTNYARPICLAKKKIVGIGESINIAGYGRNDSNSKAPSTVMREGVIMTVEYEYCRNGKDPTILCTIGQDQSTCNGDSGTIAFIKKNGFYIAVGITSTHTDKNCILGKPASFMRVSNYYSFIEENMK